MRQAIKRLFGRKTPPGSKSADAAAARTRSERAENRDSPHTIEDNSDNAVRRQLVQMMLRDGLRKHGIPPGWVECRLRVVHSRSRGPGLHVNLVMRHWDMLLLTYAHAFQQQLRAAIQEFEPDASTWLHGISWELEVGDSCPYVDMPDPSIWRDIPVTPAAIMPKPVVKKAPVATAAAVAAPVAARAAPTKLTPVSVPSAATPDSNGEEQDLMRDLERMFAIRDANIEQAFSEAAPLDFQNTQPVERS